MQASGMSTASLQVRPLLSAMPLPQARPSSYRNSETKRVDTSNDSHMVSERRSRGNLRGPFVLLAMDCSLLARGLRSWSGLQSRWLVLD